jgi:hypothetical protein
MSKTWDTISLPSFPQKYPPGATVEPIASQPNAFAQPSIELHDWFVP